MVSETFRSFYSKVHTHLSSEQNLSKAGTRREGGILGWASVGVADHGSQKHSNHGESHGKFGQWTERSLENGSAKLSFRNVQHALAGTQKGPASFACALRRLYLAEAGCRFR